MPEKRNKVKRRKAVLDNQNKVKDEARRLDGYKCANPNCMAKDRYNVLYQRIKRTIRITDTQKQKKD